MTGLNQTQRTPTVDMAGACRFAKAPEAQEAGVCAW